MFMRDVDKMSKALLTKMQAIEMENRARLQPSSSYYSPYTRQLLPLLPESPIPSVPDIERTGVEWFDMTMFEIVEAVQNRDQGVPSSPFSDTTEIALNSQETDFTVPSTPVHFKLRDLISAGAEAGAQTLSPQVVQIVPFLDEKSPKITTGHQVTRNQNIEKKCVC